MIVNEKEIKVNFFITTPQEISENLIKKYFKKEDCEKSKETEKEFYLFISNSDVSRIVFRDFMLELIENKYSFEIVVDSEEDFAYEKMIFNNGDDYIVRSFIPEEYLKKDGNTYLIGMLFHSKEEKIYLKDLK